MEFSAHGAESAGGLTRSAGSLPVSSTSSRGDQRTSSGVSLKAKGTPWSVEEHTQFLRGLEQLGNWRGISRFFVPTRTPTQVASHAQKHFLRVGGTTKRRSRFAAIEEQLYKGGGLGAQSGLGPQKTITKADSAHGLGLPPRALAHSRSSSSQMLTEPQAPARAATAPQQQQGLGGSFGACDASVAEPTNAAWAGSTPQLPATLGQQERVWLGQQLVVWGVPGAAAGFAVAQQASSAQVAPAGVSQPAQASAPGGVTVVSGYPSGAFFSLPAYNQASMQPALGFPAPRSGASSESSGLPVATQGVFSAAVHTSPPVTTVAPPADNINTTPTTSCNTPQRDSTPGPAPAKPSANAPCRPQPSLATWRSAEAIAALAPLLANGLGFTRGVQSARLQPFPSRQSAFTALTPAIPV